MGQVPWPQPQGIFTAGSSFSPTIFLKTLREVYKLVVIEKCAPEALSLEINMFTTLLNNRTETRDGLILFKLFDNFVVSSQTPDKIFTRFEDGNYLRLDCLS
jgi:hypothetical protein